MGEDMFKDLALSRERMRDYHSKLDSNSNGRKLNAMVLQRSAWPFSKNKKTVDLPPDVSPLQPSPTAIYPLASALANFVVPRCKRD